MLDHDAMNLFDEANRLWFDEGYTSKAIEKYKEALRLSNHHPVIAFQLASALGRLGRKGEALEYLAISEQKRQLLGVEGRRQLDALKRQLQSETPESPDGGGGSESLDIEQLEQQKLAKRDWFRVALAAERKQLYGVALRAYELSERSFLDPDLLNDEEEVRFQIEQHLELLKDMQNEML